MFGILLMSHGHMAEGIRDSCTLFFGENLEKVKALCLLEGDSPEAFDDQIREAIKELDDGHGVIAFCDLLGGTPFNRCAFSFVNERFQLIAGMNFPMVLELLGKRMMTEDISEIDIDELMNVGRAGIVSANKLLNL